MARKPASGLRRPHDRPPSQRQFCAASMTIAHDPEPVAGPFSRDELHAAAPCAGVHLTPAWGASSAHLRLA